MRAMGGREGGPGPPPPQLWLEPPARVLALPPSRFALAAIQVLREGTWSREVAGESRDVPGSGLAAVGRQCSLVRVNAVLCREACETLPRLLLPAVTKAQHAAGDASAGPPTGGCAPQEPSRGCAPSGAKPGVSTPQAAFCGHALSGRHSAWTQLVRAAGCGEGGRGGGSAQQLCHAERGQATIVTASAARMDRQGAKSMSTHAARQQRTAAEASWAAPPLVDGPLGPALPSTWAVDIIIFACSLHCKYARTDHQLKLMPALPRALRGGRERQAPAAARRAASSSGSAHLPSACKILPITCRAAAAAEERPGARQHRARLPPCSTGTCASRSLLPAAPGMLDDTGHRLARPRLAVDMGRGSGMRAGERLAGALHTCTLN